jgi:MoxR-like ATPase
MRELPTIDEARRTLMIEYIMAGVKDENRSMAWEYWQEKPNVYIEEAYNDLLRREKEAADRERAKLTTFGGDWADEKSSHLIKAKEDIMPNVVNVTIRVTDYSEGKGEVIDGQYPSKATTIKNPRLRSFNDGDLLDVTLMVGRGEVKWGDVQLRDAASVKAAPVQVGHGWTKIGTEFFSPAERLLFETAMKELENRPLFVLQAVGDSGYGKTSRFHAWASHTGLDCLDIHCPTMRDPAEWFGYEEVGPQGTFFAESAFSEMIQRGQGVAILDEITRVNPLIANSLLSVLDFRRSVRVHGRVITLGDHLLIGMTANKGLGYTATYEMDAALMRRVDATFEVGAPPQEVEEEIVKDKTGINAETATLLVSLLNKLRDANQDETKALHDETNSLQINTGSALKIGMLVRGGMNLRQAVEFVSINTAPIDLRRELTTQVNSVLGKTFRAF